MRKHTRTRWILLTGLLIVLLAVLAACGGDDDESGENGESEETAPTATVESVEENGDTAGMDEDGGAVTATMDVSMTDNAFEPQEITVAPGTTVVWTNNGENPHTVVSGTRDAPTDMFDSGNVAPGDTFEFTFDQEGTYDYFCSIHEGMSGTVTVSSQ